MLKYRYLFVLFVFFAHNLTGQKNDYSIESIPDSLKENADVVIRDHTYEYIIQNTSNAVVKETKVLSILNKAGEASGYIKIPYDKFSSVYFLEAYVYDKFGRLINQVKKKDIRDVSDFDSFSNLSDNRFKSIGKPVLNPPYTIKYKYMKELNGILFLPSWYPVRSENVSVEKSKFIFKTQQGYRYNLKTSPKDHLITRTENPKDKSVVWTAEGLKAFDAEPYNNEIDNYVPYILLSPVNFKISGYEGSMKTWDDLGNWSYKLNYNRDLLSDEIKSEILELTKDAKSDHEKIKLIYKYMQSKTRYISIQLGIGGWQSFPAEDTHRNGYGDCKALTVYTKGLLKQVGIESYGALVNAGRNATPIQKDFVSQQFNHIILCVPVNKDTVWLECTDQDIPAGFLGRHTDDRDVLITDSEGKSKIAHTPLYEKERNTLIRAGKFSLSETGDISGEIETEYGGLQYEYIYYILKYSDSEKIKKLKEYLDIKRLEINSFNYSEKRDFIPSIQEKLDVSIQKYATISSNRIFLSANILSKKTYVPDKIENRKTKIIFRRGYIDIDSLEYSIPDGYKPEYLPKEKNIENQFGAYQSKTEFIDGKLIYYRKFVINKGVFEPSTYEELRKFYNLIYKEDKKTVVFVKE